MPIYDITAFNTGPDAELVEFVPVGHGPDSPDERLAIYCIDLGAPPADGSFIRATAEVEFTNDPAYVPGKYRVFTATEIILTSTVNGATGMSITEGNGYNLTQEMHHGVHSKAGTILLPTGSYRQYVTLVAWAKSTSATSQWLETDQLKVEQGYGRLAVELFTPVTS